MDHSWMYGKCNTHEYMLGVENFIKYAEENKSKNGEEFLVCPCYDCKNLRKFRSSEQVRNHLICRGFKEDYNRWIRHGESVIPSNRIDNDQENDDDNDEKNVDNEENEENDRIDELMRDIQGDDSEMPPIFESFSIDSEKSLYPGCSKFTKLFAVLKLYNLKAMNRWSDKNFTQLLDLLKDMFPNDNELPISTYECGASRYKRKNVAYRCEDNKSPPAKVLWYLPVIPRFKRLFANKNDAKNLQWHAKGRKEDGKLRHPADSPQWRYINRMFPEFGNENRNLRLGLCTDGMNPHGNMSSQHSTWPVLLVAYNLPRLCMKHNYIMLSLLISGPKQPGNDIDVYLSPLVEDLKMLWEESVMVFDAYSQTNFTLRAMLFCTINDFPEYALFVKMKQVIFG
ncbi:PREDICTED: uncharacterized protein LOC109147363 [Ipomoea nil]|uniref:uncharacterized protein LOC109147363 n=1 Tax=Ipomoea nil TaxID=35883 RepID=UPI000900FA8C|nr:PREDICTED: uncharacterized protein LOC109147363 [Ipomoea nil]